MGERMKGHLVVVGTVVVTLIVLRFIAGSSIPGLNTVAKLAVGGGTVAG